MDQKTQFIADYLRRSLSFVELCEMYGISRKTGYKWVSRYLTNGPAALEDQSRRPRSSPTQTPEYIVAALIEARQRHPSWGAKKILTLVHKKHPWWPLPHRSTVCDIFKRRGLVPKKRNRRRIGHPGKPTSLTTAPNNLWAADFKGEFKTRDGLYCYPLTITDGYSRFLLACQGLHSTAVDHAKPVFTRVFKQFGLPQRIRTDNGVPFATNTLARLSRLSAWWVRLGVIPELIEPGKPQQNGRHERMHKTLKAEATRPPAATLRAQQRKFNTFRDEFNYERPHEALDQQTPASQYQPSTREMPNRLPPLEYPNRFELRYVSANGGIRWRSDWVNVSIVCAGEYVGLEEIDDGVWNVYFGPLKLGRFLERYMRIEDAYGRLNRRR
ncbi:MAG: IS481 family transposase [Gammaproteobacteria bacterium]|nr:IS481 family transposase [Gammaproteobacteria bacterium]